MFAPGWQMFEHIRTLVKHVWHCLASVRKLFEHCSNTCPTVWHVFEPVQTLQLAMCAIWRAVRTLFEHLSNMFGTVLVRTSPPLKLVQG